MSTLLLSEAPFRGLLSRAILEDVAATARPAGPVLLATRAAEAPAGFSAVPLGVVPDAVTEVVLTGLFLDRTWLDHALATAAIAVGKGVRLRVHNLGLDGKVAMQRPAGIEVLDSAGVLGLRDHRSAGLLTLWHVAAGLRVQGYPERHVEADATLAARLREGAPAGPVLGVAIRASVFLDAADLDALAQRLDAMRGWSVLPLPVAAPGAPDDDLPSSLAAAARLLPGARALLPELAEPVFWRRQLTPARLKGLVACCQAVMTNRDLPGAYAVACGVPVLGLPGGADRRIVTCLATLANELAPGSAMLDPAACRAAPGPVA